MTLLGEDQLTDLGEGLEIVHVVREKRHVGDGGGTDPGRQLGQMAALANPVPSTQESVDRGRKSSCLRRFRRGLPLRAFAASQKPATSQEVPSKEISSRQK